MIRLRTVFLIAFSAVTAAIAVTACLYLSLGERTAPGPSPSPGNPPGESGAPSSAREMEEVAPFPPGIQVNFVDVTDRAGIRFKHFDGRTERQWIMDAIGPGLAWIDYDQDGLMDLFLVQGSAVVPPYPTSPPPCKLYKNLGGGRFRDVTEEAGLDHRGCGQGVAVGDIDNDGYPDLFLTCYGQPNVLYHNEADGKGGRHFVDVSARAHLADHPDWHTRPNWCTSAAFLDYDNDGLLDLFVCSYVQVDLAHYPDCGHNANGRRRPCLPKHFEGTHCLLYRNNGNGTFTDVSHETGIDRSNAKALAVVTLDLDDDGLVDVFVANDGEPNFLFHNLGHGRFESLGESSGCAVNSNGEPQAYMGVDADDLDGDGRPDLFVTAFSKETNTLFRNLGQCLFLDATRGSGLGPPSWFKLAFGTCFVDVDRDGSPDVAVANGHVFRYVEEDNDPNVTFRQAAQLFLNDGRGHFRDISTLAGPYFRQPHLGRGLACADYDNDGHMDLAFANSGESPALLHNETQTPYHWVRLELRGTKSNRDAIGARVTLDLPGGRSLVRHRKGGGSYLSAGDPRLLVGLGTATRVDRVAVRWPSGLVQRVGPLEADRGYLVVEGQDRVTPRP